MIVNPAEWRFAESQRRVIGSTPENFALQQPLEMARLIGRSHELATDRWTPIEPLARARYSQAAVLLDDGSVAVFGGRTHRGVIREIERTKN